MSKKLANTFMKKPLIEGSFFEDGYSLNDDNDILTVTDANGNVYQVRFTKSFEAKLIQSPSETKKYYEELKNEVLSYKSTRSRVSWHYDAINVGRTYVMKFAIRGKTLVIYLPLNAEKLGEKYKVESTKSKRFEDLTCAYRIKNDRRCKYAKELIDMACEKFGLKKGAEQHLVYNDIPYESNKSLIDKGLIKMSVFLTK